MPEIKVKIENKIAKTLNNVIVCGNSDYTVKFLFDEEWEQEPLKIARFIWNKEYVDVQFSGDTCEMPVVSKTDNLAIGVYAGELRTTTPAIFSCRKSILCNEVIEHSLTPTEYEEIMKILNAHAVDIAALKKVDESIREALDDINETAYVAKLTANTAKAKAEAALANSEANKADIETLYDEKNIIASRLTETENTLNNVKITAETAKTKAEEALARNVFTDEEKAKLANITNPMVIKGRVDTVEDLPTAAEIGWFYFVGLESASSYQEYCYSETGWEFVGTSEEGVDLSNYYTKAQIDSKNQTLEGKIQQNTTAIEEVNTNVGESVSDIYGKITSLTNSTTSLQSNVNTLIDEKNLLGSRLTTAETNISNLQTNVSNLQTKVNANTTDIANLKTQAQTLESEIQENTAAIEEVNTNVGESVSDIYGKITSLTNSTTSLQTDMLNLIDEKNLLGSRLTEAETDIDNLQTDVGSLQTKVNTNTTDIANLKKQDQTLEGYIQTNTSMINLNSTDIENLQTDISTLNDEKNLLGSRLTEAENDIDNINSAVAETKTLAETNQSNINKINVSAGSSIKPIYLDNGTPKACSYTLGAASSRGVDTTPTNLSDDLITSGAVYESITELDEKTDATNTVVGNLSNSLQSLYSSVNSMKNSVAINKTTLGTQRKNLLQSTATTKTVSGVTFTVNDDKSITVNGTATARIIFVVGSTYISQTGNYTYTGTPSGGASSTYSMNYRDSSSVYKTAETGSGITTEFTGGKTYYAVIDIRSGITISSKTFYPMLRDADVTDSTYETYQPSLQEQITALEARIAALGG